MTQERNRELEARIQERLERLGIDLHDCKGYFYLSEVLYVLLEDTTINNIERAEIVVSKKLNISLYELQSSVADILVLANDKVLRSFKKAEKYDLKLIYNNIELIADDIREELEG